MEKIRKRLAHPASLRMYAYALMGITTISSLDKHLDTEDVVKWSVIGIILLIIIIKWDKQSYLSKENMVMEKYSLLVFAVSYIGLWILERRFFPRSMAWLILGLTTIVIAYLVSRWAYNIQSKTE